MWFDINTKIKKNETKQRKKQIKNLTYKKMKVAKLTNSDLINGEYS
jgi:hypothetical protein